MRIVPAFPIVLALSLILAAPAFAGQATLAETFCDALVALDTSAATVAGDDALWTEVVARLERRLPTGRSADDLRPCIERFGPDFEDAEFVLKGRELVQSAIPQAGAVASEAEPRVTSLEIPQVGEVALDEVLPAPRPADATHGIEARGQRYESLWRDFLAKLRTRLALLPVPVQLFVTSK